MGQLDIKLIGLRLGKHIVESIDVVDELSDVFGNVSPYLIPCIKSILKNSNDFVRISLVILDFFHNSPIHSLETND